ncbi:MAG: POTRA domain-containing protein, partial [Kangiellaceae bacterium]|nr:POTRA domain-containing protein [Kangiellaceae bacterium]
MQSYFSILFKSQRKISKFWLLVLICLLCSCNIVKRVKKDEHLITKNTILEDGEVTKDGRINGLIVQKPNQGVEGVLSFPLRLHIYNLARPNIDSILQEKVLSDSSKVRWKTKVLSKKQFNREIQARKDFNSWLKRTGEAPTILDEDQTQKTVTKLRKYYYTKGWFNNEVDYEVIKDSSKKAQVIYKVTKKDPYILDTVIPIINSPAIAS